MAGPKKRKGSTAADALKEIADPATITRLDQSNLAKAQLRALSAVAEIGARLAPAVEPSLAAMNSIRSSFPTGLANLIPRWTYPLRLCAWNENPLLVQLSRGEISIVGEHPATGEPVEFSAAQAPSMSIDHRQDTVTIDGLVVAKNIRVVKGLKSNERNSVRRMATVADVKAWYIARRDSLTERGERSSEDQDVAAAHEHYGDRVSRKMIRDLRSNLVPADWTRRGRRARD
ncbi:MAG TPA: hypothetical protein VMF53_06740 [Alphaproteobacteria bacterium]|nr:hypothetical protein [Alphaproteobacteria bacterium]